jgi:hypothetical protein
MDSTYNISSDEQIFGEAIRVWIDFHGFLDINRTTETEILAFYTDYLDKLEKQENT